MSEGDRDPPFPQCCTRCPHLESVTAACGHPQRQSLVANLENGRTCPVFVIEKTSAMDQLVQSL